jgi:hypothetical protein
MRASRLVLALVLLAVAVLAVLVARAARVARDVVRADDAQYLRAGAPEWRPGTWLPLDLVGGDADLEQRRALVLVRRALRPAAPFGGQERQADRGAAASALSAIAQRGEPALASQAADLLGVLAFTDGQGVDRALAGFEQAYRLDRGNEDAKYNLELVLRLLRPTGTREGTSSAAGPRGDRGRGAGAGRPGRGY